MATRGQVGPAAGSAIVIPGSVRNDDNSAMLDRRECTRLQFDFARSWAETLNPGLAYRIAYNPGPGVADRTIRNEIRELLSLPHVVAAYEKFKADVAATSCINLRALLIDWYDIATADPNEIVTYEAVNCRHCYGEGHAYQWKQGEYWEACAAAIAAEKQVPDEAGGIGYDQTALPNADCPECKGEGVMRAKFADTRHLTGKARKLFKGVRVGRNGMVEVLMHDQMQARDALARVLGAFPEMEKPTLNAVNDMTEDHKMRITRAQTPQEAQKLYLTLVRGGKKET